MRIKKVVFITIMVIISILSVACGGVKVDKVKETVSTEIGKEVTKAEILSQKTEGKTAIVHAVITTADNIYNSEAKVLLSYYKNNGNWVLSNLQMEGDGWKTYPVDSAAKGDTRFIANYFEKEGVMVETGKIPLKADYIQITSLESEKLELKEPYSEEIKGSFKYETPNGEGFFDGSIKLDFSENAWRVKEFVQTVPMKVNWKSGKGFQVVETEFKRELAAMWFGGVEVKDESVSETCRLNADDIKSVVVLSQPIPVGENEAMAKVHIAADKGVATVECDAFLKYREQDLKWYMYEVTEVESNQKIKYKTDMVGTWEGFYIVNGEKRNATLNFDNFIKQNNVYEGTFSFGSSEKFKSPSGKYSVVGSYDLNNNSFGIKAGNWMNQPEGYSTQNFAIKTVEGDTIGGSPQAWFGQKEDLIQLKKKAK